MPELVLPDVGYRTSFLAAMEEFADEGRAGDGSMVGTDLVTWADRWRTEDGFAAYVGKVRADAVEETPHPAHIVPSTTWWWVDGEEYLGRLALRHRLNDRLLEWGGHIGYDVRRSRRRQGHATAMLRAALPETRAKGIDPALVTCDPDNVGSRKVIEAVRGRFEDERSGKLRYWVPTG